MEHMITKQYDSISVDQSKDGKSEMLYVKNIFDRYGLNSTVVILSPEISVSTDHTRKKVIETRTMTIYKYKKLEEIKS